MSTTPTTWILGGGGIGKACFDLLKQDEERIPIMTGSEVDVTGAKGMFEILSECPNIREIVYTAGIADLRWTKDIDDAGMLAAKDVFEVNVLGFIRLLGMLQQLHRHPYRITVISSDAAWRPMRTSIAYCASKAALNMAVRVAARELGPKGWKVNAVCPGMVADTGMTRYIDQRVPEVRGWSIDEALRYEAQQGVVPGRINPMEVAEVVKDLLDGPDHYNGSIIEFNGGR